jgi:hypothetical protein
VGVVISVRIEELVLHGFDPRQRHAIGAAVERELARLLHDPAPVSARAVARVDGGSFDVPRDAPPAVVGTHIARAIHAEVRR